MLESTSQVLRADIPQTHCAEQSIRPAEYFQTAAHPSAVMCLYVV